MQYISTATSFPSTPRRILHLLSLVDPLLFHFFSEKSKRLGNIKPESLTLMRWTLLCAQADALLEGKEKKMCKDPKNWSNLRMSSFFV